ncbi:MAG: 23S rRNA (uracil(1939)-C(5))-methyltransferase RlmD [Lachnospiraceae bacterium]|nr:23S rRNA (uracil(1939)-C(5))-methyltransferase RlmD [Lachnospiraceae bacterium]
MKKNDIFTVTIEDMSHTGEGIGKVDGFPLFIKDTIIGDVASVKVMKLKKNYGFARLMEVIEPSKDRVTPPCSIARQCGGCQIQAMSYDAQLSFKERLVKNNLQRIGGFSEEIMNLMDPIIGMEKPYRYRNKAQFPVGEKNGKPIAGFYAGRTHDIMECEDCLLGVKENQLILDCILAYMEAHGVAAYEETIGKGLIRHVLIRKGFTTGQFMVCLVINGKKLPEEDLLCQKLLAAVPAIASICVSENTSRNNVIMGKTYRVLWGEPYIIDELDGITYRISPLSFFQVNPAQTEKLYKKALEYAGLTGNENVWDLYCGTGSISLFLARNAKMVHGVEIIEQAILDARENAKDNGLTNTEFFVGKAEDVFEEQVLGKDAEPIDVVVVDPPRKGCDEKLLSTMLKMKPQRIVYVSCDSATLARDLKILCEDEYKISKIQCVDQFPHTVHVESCVLLQRMSNIRLKAFTSDVEMGGI